MTDKKNVQLKVVEALQDDAYKGIARIDSEIMRTLDIRRGDVISIKGHRETVAIVDRAYPADVGEGIIRIDGIIRKNIKVGIGEVVTISKADVREAKKVIIAPAQKNIMVQLHGDPEGLKRGLLGRAVAKGDIVVLGGVQRRRDLFSEMGFGAEFGDLFGDAFDNVGFGNLGGGISQIKFIVVNTNPNQPVIITENTEVTLNPKAVEISDEKIPEINYEDIGGLSEEIKKIREMVEIPLKHPEIFEKLGIEPPKGVLLHGPPGTGKTLLAKAVATETSANFILLNGPEIMSKYYGESEKKIRDIFDEAEKTAPAIIFIDEIDAIAPKREETIGEVERRVVSQILTMMDGLKSRGKVIVIGATNRINSLDPALRRPGRFDREIAINAPDKEGRLNILKIHTRGMPLVHFDVNVAEDILMNEIKNHENMSREKIISLESKMPELNTKIKEAKKNIAKLEDDLYNDNEKLRKLNKEKLEIEKQSEKSYDDSLISKLGYLLRKKTSDIKELGSKIEEINNSINEKKGQAIKSGDLIKKYEENIDSLRKDIVKINKAKEKLKENKSFLAEIIKQMKFISEERLDIEKIVSGRDDGDARNIFLGKDYNKLGEDFEKLKEDLYDAGVISEEMNSKIKKSSVEVMLRSSASITHGFVGADLHSLTKESAMNVLRKYLPQMKLDEEKQIPQDVLEKLVVKQEDFMAALKTVRPSAMREVLIETPNVGWNEVGGLEGIKQELKEAVEWPIKNPESFERLGIRPSRGILLYGPPGTGKTLLAKAVAKESEANFIQIKGPSLLSMWVGKSEEGVRKIFERARQVAPCIIFFDEIDSLAGKRGMDNGTKVTERVLNQILAEMDGLEELKDIIVIGATNRPDMLDPALLRPGRFDKILLVNAPEEDGRYKILQVHTRKMPIGDGRKLLGEKEKEAFLMDLAKRTIWYSGADLEAMVREAALLALRKSQDAKHVTKEDFEESFKRRKQSISKQTIDTYKKIEENFLKQVKSAVSPSTSYLG